MLKVHILTHCEHSDGEAYLPVGEAESYSGNHLTCNSLFLILQESG